MNHWDAFILGLVQGITEFLPVSSSGHLILIQHFLGYQNFKEFILFDLVCHLGTLAAILIVFATSIKDLLHDQKKIGSLFIAILPLFFLLPFLKEIKSLFETAEYLGFSFLFTSALLLIAEKMSYVKPEPALADSYYRDRLKIGISQAFAIIPGISRSGTTISTARLLGWKPQEAATFSFLLSIPTIMGGIVLEILKFSQSNLAWTIYLLGFATSFFVGIVTLKLLLKLLGTAQFKFFAWYLLLLGMFSLYHFS